MAQIETYFSEHGTFDGLQMCGSEEKEELMALIDADLMKLASTWEIPKDILESPSIVRTADFLLKMNELFPEIYLDPTSLKSVMKSRLGFTCHRDVYGLKKWKQHKPGTAIIQVQRVLKEIDQLYPVKTKDYWKARWEERFEELKTFAEAHSRLPKKEGPEQENKLFYWMTSQVNRNREGKLDPMRQAMLKEFNDLYPAKTAAYWEDYWNEKFGELRAFA